MIDKAYLQKLARYNRWQNENLYGAAETLSDEERKRERGAFFGSIHGTFNHLVWADRIWLSRFAGTPKPSVGIKGSAALYPDWAELKRERAKLDETIVGWADGLATSPVQGDLVWFSGATQREISMPKWITLAHFFNHQTHHRGQIHCMLTQAGAKPEDTDLVFMPS
jgi:uncharacterized damage-inducible protein DinB